LKFILSSFLAWWKSGILVLEYDVYIYISITHSLFLSVSCWFDSCLILSFIQEFLLLK
jgi:hypothetical protein